MAKPELELKVERVAHGGVFVARHEGRVVFVSDTLPGERVRARVTDDRKSQYWRADTVEVLDAARERREHIWSAASLDRPPAERAGGAEFGHIMLEHQRELKAHVIAESLSRFAQLDRAVLVEPVDLGADAPPGAAEDGTRWRTRVRLHVDAAGRVGPYAARSHDVIPVDDLPLATTAVVEAAPLEGRFPGAAHIDVVVPSTGHARVSVADRTSRRRGRKDAAGRRSRETARPVRELITEIVAGRPFTLDLDGFWQVHTGAAETLYRAVQSAIDEDLFDSDAENLDLYGGVGLLAAAVTDRFGGDVRMTSVEADARAATHAAANLGAHSSANAVNARVDRYLDELAQAKAPQLQRLRAATVVLDPPRSGAGRAVIERLVELQPRQIVYVACDPVALARDLGLLRAHGYELDELRAFDLFPNTHHVEAVARLTSIVGVGPRG